MAVTDLTITPIGGSAWRLAWSSDLAGATCRVYRDGVLEASTQGGDHVVAIADGEAPVFEVLDDPAAEPLDGFPPRVTLAWYAPASGAGAASYRVELFEDGAWASLASVAADASGYQRWQSGPLDAGSHQFRVVPVGAGGNDGTPTTFTTLVLRVPDPPAVSVAYDAGTATATLTQA